MFPLKNIKKCQLIELQNLKNNTKNYCKMNQNLNNIYLDYNQGQGTCDSTPFCLKIMCKVAKFLAAKVLDNPFMTYIYIHPFWVSALF